MPLFIYIYPPGHKSKPFAKAFVAEHQRRLKNGKTVTIAAYYDKRVKKAAQYAPDHGHDVNHLSDEDKAKFSNMHKEQHVAHFYEVHALSRKLAAEQQLLATLERSAKRYEVEGNKKSVTAVHNKIYALKQHIRRHERDLNHAKAIVEGIGKMKHKLIEGSGELKDDADKQHAHYVEKLGERFATSKQKPILKPENFIAAPDGATDFGEITPEISKQIRRQAGKIKLQIGIDSPSEKYGVAHIEAGHKKEIEALGLSIPEFVAKATKKPDEIRQGSGSALLLVKQITTKPALGKLVFVRLKPSEKGDFYRVETAFVKPMGRISKNYPLLWSASVPHPEESSIPLASATASSKPAGDDRSTGAPAQSNDDTNIPQPAKKASLDDDLIPNSPNYRYRDTGNVSGSSKEKAANRIKNAGKTGARLNATDIDWQEIEQNPREAKTLITKANLFGAVDWNALKVTGMEPGAGFLIDKVYHSIAKEGGNSERERKDYALGLQTIRDRMEPCKTPDEVMRTLSEISDEFMGKMQSESGENAKNPLSDVWTSLGKNFVGLIKRGYKYSGINYAQFNPAIYKSGNKTFLTHAINAKKGDVKDWSWAEKDPRTGSGKAMPREKPFQLLVADKITRKGGKQINIDSTKALKDLVGLRDVQSGNWVLKDKDSAIFHVQKCAEAFSDLSDILGVPLNKIALNGRLAMAFGARGHGNALAHYEPVQRVINLTKMKGGGSLAHEWLHSVDNMIAEMEGGQAGTVNHYISENPDLLPNGKVKDAVIKLRKAMMEGDMPIKAVVQYMPKDIATAKYNFDNASYGLAKDIKTAGSLDKAIDAINRFYTGRTTPKSFKSAANWRRITAAYYDNNPAGGAVPVATGEKYSAFAGGALNLDKGKKNKYWSKPREMAARAFEAYVTDKLKVEGRENTYLSAHADNNDYKTGNYEPYPQGQDRANINAAYDELFSALRESGTLQKAFSTDSKRPKRVMLFLRKEAAEANMQKAIFYIRKDSPLAKSFIPAHTRRLKNGKVIQVAAYSDKRLRKDAQSIYVDHDGINAEDKAHWARLHQEQHVLHHTDKALHERRIKEANKAIAHHHAKAAHHEAQRDIARKKGDTVALSEHNKALAHHHNQAQKWTNSRAGHERQLAKINHKLEGIKALKEQLWKGSGEVSKDEQKLLNRVPSDAPIIKTDGGDIGKAKNITEMSKATRDYAQKNFAGKTVRNKDTGDAILISMKGIKHTTYNAQAELLKTVAVLPEILEKSKYIGNDKDKKQLNAKVHYYGVKIEMDGKILDVVSVVKEDGNGNRYYDHSIERNGGRAVQRISKTTPEMPPQEPEGSAKSITEPAKKASQKITPTGKDNEVKTAKGTKVNTQFAVVEAVDLTASHDASGNANPAYPKELQPRNRERATSQAQIARIAKNLDPDMLGRTRNASNGAPIVGDDGVVESGNGRTMAINQAYQSGHADDYRDWLENDAADMYGLDKKAIAKMKHPVLVRVRKTELDRAQFAREANQSDMLAMTATEKAKADANHLTDAVINKLSIDGDLSAASNRDFIIAFMGKLGDDESAGLFTTGGQPTKQLYDRAQSAIFAKAYNDDRLLELMADTDKPEIGNIIKSLNQAAPGFIKARSISEHHTQATTDKLTDAVEVSLDKKAVDAIVKATEMLKRAKDTNMPVEKFIKQGDMFGDIDPMVAQMAQFIKDNNRSPARMGEAFKAMADFLVKELEHQQNASLFDDEKPVNIIDVIQAANAHLQKVYGDQAKTIGQRTGGFIDVFTETRGQKADRERFLANHPEEPVTVQQATKGKVFKIPPPPQEDDAQQSRVKTNGQKLPVNFIDAFFNRHANDAARKDAVQNLPDEKISTALTLIDKHNLSDAKPEKFKKWLEKEMNDRQSSGRWRIPSGAQVTARTETPLKKCLLVVFPKRKAA